MNGVPIGQDIQSKKLILISELDRNTQRGLKCQCECVNCGTQLIARMGNINVHHFAHRNSDTYTKHCDETAIHLLTKEIIIRRKMVFLPLHEVKISRQSILGEEVSGIANTLGDVIPIIAPIAELTVVASRIKPDILTAFEWNGEQHKLAIEVAVTHFVDDEKKEKSALSDINMVEVDMSGLLTIKELTIESIEAALDNKKKWKWIYKSPIWTVPVKQEANHVAVLQLHERNACISDWVERVRKYYMSKCQMALYPYNYPESVNYPDYLIADRKVARLTDLPDKPTIGGILPLASIGKLNNGSIELKFIHKDEIFSIPLILGNQELTEGEQSETHLILMPQQRREGVLPEPELLEKVIYWGHNKRAKEYIDLVEDLIIQAQKKHEHASEFNAGNDIREQIKEFEDYRTGVKLPIASNRADIKDRARHYWVEMKRKGIPVDKILQEVEDGWIFGCDNEWQVLVMYILCQTSGAHARAETVYITLKVELKFYCLWPIDQLRRKRETLKKMNYDINLLPDPLMVLTRYFDILANERVLMLSINHGYEKRFICGQSFQDKQN